jgi:hypothetical protein
MPKFNEGASMALGLAIMGVVFLARPSVGTILAPLSVLLIYLSQAAAKSMANRLQTWARLLIAACATGAVVLILVLVAPPDSFFLRLASRYLGAEAILLPAWLAALWEILPDRIRGVRHPKYTE